MVRAGEEYKNYIEVCKALGEERLYGNSKKAQIKRWEQQFRWRMEGNRYVIEEVYEEKKERIDNRGGNNVRNVLVYQGYVIGILAGVKVKNDWYGTQRLLKDLFRLVPHEIYEQINKEEVSKEKFCEMYGLKDYDSFLDFVHGYEACAKETIEGCLNKLMKEGYLEWREGHMFKVGKLTPRFACTDCFEKEIKEVEETVCKTLSEVRGYKNVKGRQILRYIRHSPREMTVYYDECLKRILSNKMLGAALKIDYEEKHKKSRFNQKLVSGYYKGYHLMEIKVYKLREKAPPDYKEKKEEIILNTLERTKKRVQIPESDFKNLKTLFLSLHGLAISDDDIITNADEKGNKN